VIILNDSDVNELAGMQRRIQVKYDGMIGSVGPRDVKKIPLILKAELKLVVRPNDDLTARRSGTAAEQLRLNPRARRHRIRRPKLLHDRGAKCYEIILPGSDRKSVV